MGIEQPEAHEVSLPDEEEREGDESQDLAELKELTDVQQERIELLEAKLSDYDRMQERLARMEDSMQEMSSTFQQEVMALSDAVAGHCEIGEAEVKRSEDEDENVSVNFSDNAGYLGDDNTEGKVRVDGVGLLTKTKGGASPDEHIVIGHAADAHDGRYPPIGDGGGDGDIIYWDGDSWETLPAGTPPCVLVIDSAGLRWQTIDTAYKGIFRTSGGDIDDDWVRAKA